MTRDEAQKHADRMFGTTMVLETTNGTHRIRHPTEGVVAAAPSWLAALRYASKPLMERMRKEQAEKAAKDRAEMAEAQKEMATFAEFLREKFDAEFDAWKASRAAEETPADGPASASQSTSEETPADGPAPTVVP